MIERQIIHIVSERVLEFVPDGGEPNDDVCCGDGPRDRNPAKGAVELKGEEVDVEEDDLGDENVVSEWQRCGENPLGGGLGVC